MFVFQYHLLLILIITGPPTYSVGGQTSNDCWCLSSSVVCRRLSSVTLPAGGPADRRARGRSGGLHSTASQYGYVSLGRHLVLTSNYIPFIKIQIRKPQVCRQSCFSVMKKTLDYPVFGFGKNTGCNLYSPVHPSPIPPSVPEDDVWPVLELRAPLVQAVPQTPIIGSRSALAIRPL